MAITVRSVPEAFQPYVLEVPWDAEEDGSSLAVVLVVIKKPSAVLLAAPKGFFAEETLIDGMQAGPDWGLLELFTVRARRLEEMDGTPPVAEQGIFVSLVLVDMTRCVGSSIKGCRFLKASRFAALVDEDPFRFPMRDDLVAAAWDWLVQPDAGDRFHHYSAAEELEEEDVGGKGSKAICSAESKEAYGGIAGGVIRECGGCSTYADESVAGAFIEDQIGVPQDLLKEMPPPQQASKMRAVPVPPFPRSGDSCFGG